ncbi:hypothetical protein Dsin_016322 [Dipteronia sinensis]|uniref:Uncharacterized protein n=1 Tax=Dipteronia sinensis TaxID=43782 RepID=A0AAE0ACV5_9ROSI|nr:hypothetical protein Dsin_016322 [Dipteronia sinensis]
MSSVSRLGAEFSTSAALALEVEGFQIYWKRCKTKMSSATKADKKAAVDAAAWMFNVVTSVGIIIVNKALMATYGFSLGTSL